MGLCERELVVANADARRMDVERARVANPKRWLDGNMDGNAKRLQW